MESGERFRRVNSASAQPSAGLSREWTSIDASVDEGGASMAAFTEAVWRKSSWSSYNGNCVAVAKLRGQLVGVRDTKQEDVGQVLVFDSTAWRSFVNWVKSDSQVG